MADQTSTLNPKDESKKIPDSTLARERASNCSKFSIYEPRNLVVSASEKTLKLSAEIDINRPYDNMKMQQVLANKTPKFQGPAEVDHKNSYADCLKLELSKLRHSFKTASTQRLTRNKQYS